MKFKVGDRVRFVKSIIYHTKAVKLGGIYTVKTIDNKNKQYLVGCENKHGEFFKEEELALAEYKYEDLKKSPTGTKITFENGEVLLKDNDGNYSNKKRWRDDSDLKELKDRINTLGKIIKIEEPTYQTVYEVKQEILDEAEKRYLRGVIRPFRNNVEVIRKLFSPTKGKYFIQIRYKDEPSTNLPYFENEEMYKNMKTDKIYTLEELEL